METTSHALKQKAIEEMKKFLFIALYLWLVFGLLVMYKSVILGEYHIDFAFHDTQRSEMRQEAELTPDPVTYVTGIWGSSGLLTPRIVASPTCAGYN